jgi:hypothetical protein
VHKPINFVHVQLPEIQVLVVSSASISISVNVAEVFNSVESYSFKGQVRRLPLIVNILIELNRHISEKIANF